MANEEHIKILKEGVKVWNKWRQNNPEIEPDLSKIYLSQLNLEGANLTLADLSDTYIFGCKLRNAVFNQAKIIQTTFDKINLIEADLSQSELVFCYFYNGSLKKTTLAKAHMYYTTFFGVDLKDTNFSNAYMDESSFNSVDLSLAEGLESVMHFGPSTIGVDTLYKSAGKIPEKFLRGCGVPDDFITFIPSHFGIQEAIQFYSCFISYSNKDEEFARRLHSRMREENLRVWFAPEDMKGGQKFYEQIEQAIQIHDRLLLILSEESMKSNWVIREVRRARKTEREQNRRKLFPIRLVDFETIKNWEALDIDTGEDIAEEVRSYHIPDFSNWKDHDSFEKGFARLLKDLRDEEAKQGKKRKD